MPQTAEKNKAVKIRALLEAGYSTTGIAGIIGCRSEYVRAVRARQQGRSGMARWEIAALEAGDRETARKRANDAYRQARNSGMSTRAASSKKGAAYARAMVATGRAVLRSQRGNAA